MNLVLNIILFMLIALLVVHNFLLLALFLTALFSYRAGAVWLLPLAFAIDGYFGAFHALPLFSMFAAGWYVLTEFIRPQLMLQRNSYETTS